MSSFLNTCVEFHLHSKLRLGESACHQANVKSAAFARSANKTANTKLLEATLAAIPRTRSRSLRFYLAVHYKLPLRCFVSLFPPLSSYTMAHKYPTLWSVVTAHKFYRGVNEEIIDKNNTILIMFPTESLGLYADYQRYFHTIVFLITFI